MDIVIWLRSLGLGKYEAAFRENEIDETVLSSLTHETLRSLASRQLGIASSSWMPLPLCVAIRAPRRHPLTHQLRPPSRAHLQKTAPSAATSR